jgi:hypothetical protein
MHTYFEQFAGDTDIERLIAETAETLARYFPDHRITVDERDDDGMFAEWQVTVWLRSEAYLEVDEIMDRFYNEWFRHQEQRGCGWVYFDVRLEN